MIGGLSRHEIAPYDRITSALLCSNCVEKALGKLYSILWTCIHIANTRLLIKRVLRVGTRVAWIVGKEIRQVNSAPEHPRASPPLCQCPPAVNPFCQCHVMSEMLLL